VIVFLLLSLNLTLEEAIEIGLKESPLYLKAKKTFIIQQKTNSLFYSTLLPEISGEYSYYKNRSVSGGVLSVDTISGFGLSAAWELGPDDLFNSLGTHYKNASAYYSFVDMRNSIVYEIAFQYLKTLMMKKLLESRIAAVTRSEKNLKLVEERKTLGLASSAEVLKAKVDHFQSKTNLLETKKEARVAALVLNNLIGLSAKDSLELEEPEIKFEIPSKDSVLYLAMGSDPLYNQYKAEASAAQYELIGSTTDDLFSISFSGSLQYQGNDFPSVSVLEDNYDYSIGFSVTVPIFTGFSRYNKLMINKLKKELADINLKDRERELKSCRRQIFKLQRNKRKTRTRQHDFRFRNGKPSGDKRKIQSRRSIYN
jgi:outer membrane protein TolC